jgi:hypothetical protein
VALLQQQALSGHDNWFFLHADGGMLQSSVGLLPLLFPPDLNLCLHVGNSSELSSGSTAVKLPVNRPFNISGLTKFTEYTTLSTNTLNPAVFTIST